MRHEWLDDAARDQAAIYALGSMSSSEAAAYEEHLLECRACEAEVASFGKTVEELVYAANEAEPPEKLKARLLQRLEPKVKNRAKPVLLLEKHAKWEAAGVDGVHLRYLLGDPARERHTVLVRMQPAAVYPVHAHGSAEECYVVEGDLIDGDIHMRAGDYSRYDKGTSHGPLTTKMGCLLLVTTSSP